MPRILGLGYLPSFHYRTKHLCIPCNLCENGTEELLQRDQGNEGEGITQLRKTDAFDRQCEEVCAERVGQLQC